jgi:hypothetical protein
MGQVTSIKQLRVMSGNTATSEDACWSWPGLQPGRRKQLVWTSPVTNVRRTRYVYVIAFVLATGVDPEQSTELPFVCHNCDNEHCFNPQHLYQGNYRTNREDASNRERNDPMPNLQKAIAASVRSRATKTHCKRDHELNEENTYITKRGFRQCRACVRLRQQQATARGR